MEDLILSKLCEEITTGMSLPFNTCLWFNFMNIENRLANSFHLGLSEFWLPAPPGLSSYSRSRNTPESPAHWTCASPPSCCLSTKPAIQRLNIYRQLHVALWICALVNGCTCKLYKNYYKRIGNYRYSLCLYQHRRKDTPCGGKSCPLSVVRFVKDNTFKDLSTT